MTKQIKKIVAIGGGEIKYSETLAIDKEIIRLTQKKHPKLLFIPTASSDSEGYYKEIENYFGKKLGCKTDVLYLIKETPSPEEIRNKILDSDIIYVGGGNTLKMMKRWRRLGVDKILKTAWEKGIVLCGLSAGSICWFESGLSDSMSFYNPKKWKYINVRGLGFVKGIHCPHYNKEALGIPIKTHFSNMIQKIGGIGIAIDENCAIEFLGDKFRVIASKKSARAFKVYKKNGKVISQEIEQINRLMPITTLYER
jgi:dipeptidase E